MNRRELFKGACAAFTAAAIPIPAALIELESYGVAPSTQSLEFIRYLQEVQRELIDKIINPPVILDGHRIIPLSTEVQEEALRHLDNLLGELHGRAKEIQV